MVETKLKDLAVIPRAVSMDSQFRILSNYSKQLEVLMITTNIIVSPS